jgi:hypothetical protein
MHSNTQAELISLESVTRLQQIMTSLKLVESNEDWFPLLCGVVRGNKSLKSSTVQWPCNTLDYTLFSIPLFSSQRRHQKGKSKKLKCL